LNVVVTGSVGECTLVFHRIHFVSFRHSTRVCLWRWVVLHFCYDNWN